MSSKTAPQKTVPSNDRELDFTAIGALALAHIDALLEEILPGGRHQGREYVALNPTRADNTLGSFKVNITSGAWSDFATDDCGGDLISLYAYVLQISQAESARAILKRFNGGPPQQRGRKERNTWTPILPVPNDAPEVPKAHYHYGPWSTMWPYKDGNGDLLGYVCRFDRPDKKKAVIPLTFCDDGSGERAWQWRSFNPPRPLYGLEWLAKHPEAPVLVVEGEKCADVGNLALPGWAVLSWPGGSKSTGKVDWIPLGGRAVTLWPDNDDPGRTCMQEVARRLNNIAVQVSILNPPTDKPSGWDIADAIEEGWTPEQCQQFLTSAKPVIVAESSHMAVDIPEAILTRCTDSTNAELLALLYGDRLRYDHRKGRWLVWSGHWWREDNDGEPPRLALLSARERYHVAAGISDNRIREKVAKWSIRSEDRNKISGCLDLAKSVRPIADTGETWDTDLYLLGVENGVIDLRTGTLRNGMQEDRITKHTAVLFDPNAVCPRWERFLHEVFEGNEDMIEFVRLAIGYSLTGDTREQVFFVLWGKGANGKGVLTENLRHVLGPYSFDAGFEAFAENEAHPEALANLDGRRMVTGAEVREKTNLHEQRLKALSHGDTLSARHLYGHRFEFMPQCKIWLSLNQKPRVADDSDGFWRSVRLIPFRRQFLGDDADRNLIDILHSETPGILAWAVRACLDWQKSGLSTPADVMTETSTWQREADPLAEFMENCCVVIDGFTPSADLWTAYLKWADDNKVPERERLSRRAFGLRIGELYSKERRTVASNKQWCYSGIGLLHE